MGKVDPNEAPEGYMAVESESCANCALINLGDCVSADCNRDVREDGRNVIFVKRPTKDAASFPYDDMGTYVEVTG